MSPFVRQMGLKGLVALALVSCLAPDLDDDDPVLYSQGVPLHPQKHSSMGAPHGPVTAQTDSISPPPETCLVTPASREWPAAAQPQRPEPPDLSRERPPPRAAI